MTALSDPGTLLSAMVCKFPKIENSTALRTDDLRRFLHVGLKDRGVFNSIRVRRIEIAESANHRSRGWAWQDDARIKLCIARGFDPNDRRQVIELAQIFEHEIDHCLGLEHPDQVEWWELTPFWVLPLELRYRKKIETREDRIQRQIRRLTFKLDSIATAEENAGPLLLKSGT